jgi:hypothetical protein
MEIVCAFGGIAAEEKYPCKGFCGTVRTVFYTFNDMDILA